MIKEKKVRSGSSIFKLFLLFFFICVIIISVVYAFQGESISGFQLGKLDMLEFVKNLWSESEDKQDASVLQGDFTPDWSQTFLGNLLLLSKSDLKLVNSKGEEVWYIPHEINNPVLQVNDHFVLVYEQSGKSFIVVKDGKIFLEDTLKEEIAFGNITEKYILFISKNNIGYKRAVHIIEIEKGEQLGTLYIDDYYPYYANPGTGEGQSFLLYGLGLGTTNLTTVIRRYGVNLSPNPLMGIELEGLFPVMYENTERIMFIGENSSFCYDHEFNALWSKEFETDIAAAGLFENGRAVYAMKEPDSPLLFIDASGKEIKNVPIEGQVQQIETYKNTAAVIMGAEVFFYGDTGDLIGHAIMHGINMKVNFLDEKKAYLVSEHEIILYHITSKNLNR